VYNNIVKIQAISVVFLCVLGFCINHGYAWQSDNDDGTFTNPVFYADYPDPDIIRVGSVYMVSTTFVDSPGINVLHSQDLVDWEIISHTSSTLDGGNAHNMVNGQTAYRAGVFLKKLNNSIVGD
jgi:beta-xylosidase